MNQRRLFALLTSAAMALTLAACGGGSDGGGAGTGGGAGGGGTGGGGTGGGTGGGGTGGGSPPAGETLVVSGLVTDMPIPNAAVVLTVDGQTFEAPNLTDASGAYSVEIRSANPDAMVLCEAVDRATGVRFTALLNDFEGLQQIADASGMVREVDITNVTTAQYVLATQLTDDGRIDDIEELEAVSGMVDTDALLELSAAIKVVVEAIDGAVLPEGIADTQALAEAIASGQSDFVEALAAVSPGTLEEAVERVLTDGNATTEWTAAQVPGVYLPTDGASVLVFLPDGSGLEQELDASGFPTDEGALAFQWSINEAGQLRIDVTSAAGEVESELVTLLSSAGNVVNVIVNRDGSAPQDGSERESDTAARFAFDGTGFDPATVEGTYIFLPDEESGEQGPAAVLLADGTGYNIDLVTGVQDTGFGWTIDNGVLTLSEPEGELTRVYLLAGTSTGLLRLLVMELDENGDPEYLSVGTVRYEAEVATGPSPDAANTAALAGKTYAQLDETELALFSFGEDGTFTEVFERLEDEGMWDVGEAEGLWTVDAEGVIRVSLPGSGDSGSATVVQGLGESVMVIDLGADGGSASELTQVVPFDAGEPVGTWTEQRPDGSTGAGVVFAANGSGSYTDDEGETPFEWVIDGDGLLRVFPASEEGVETVTFHKLAGSTGDRLRAALVFRLNGELDGAPVTPGSGERPGALSEGVLVRTPL